LKTKRQGADYYDQLLRLKAEFDNYRKRVEKEKLEARAWGQAGRDHAAFVTGDIFEASDGSGE